MTSACRADWEPIKIVQMDGESVAGELLAQRQIVTESWNRVVAVPYLAYLPEKDRVCMLVGCDYPHQPLVLFSDDRGATWGEPRPLSPDPKVNAAAGLGTALTYLGAGRLILSAGGRWFSNDYGDTWEGSLPIPPASNGQPWYQWDPYLVDRDPGTGEVKRLAETGHHRRQDPSDTQAARHVALRAELLGLRAELSGLLAELSPAQAALPLEDEPDAASVTIHQVVPARSTRHRSR